MDNDQKLQLLDALIFPGPKLISQGLDALQSWGVLPYLWLNKTKDILCYGLAAALMLGALFMFSRMFQQRDIRNGAAGVLLALWSSFSLAAPGVGGSLVGCNQASMFWPLIELVGLQVPASAYVPKRSSWEIVADPNRPGEFVIMNNVTLKPVDYLSK